MQRILVTDRRRWLLAGLSILSAVLALTAIFVLAEWAEMAAWHHAAQHILIFIAGLGFGSSLVMQLPSKGGES